VIYCVVEKKAEKSVQKITINRMMKSSNSLQWILPSQIDV
jgi:hypothetical protein